MYKSIIIIHIICYSFSAYCQNATRYHRVEMSVTYPILVEWNAKYTDTACYLVENINKSGNVLSMYYLCKGKPYDDFEIGIVPRFEYQYKPNIIVESRLENNRKPYYGLEGGVPSTITYYLKNDSIIDSCKCETFIPSDIYKHLDSSQVKQAIKEIVQVKKCDFIDQFYYSNAKYHGIFPRSSNKDSIPIPWYIDIHK